MRTLLALIALSAAGETLVPIPFACTADDIEHFGLNCSADQPCPVYADLNFVAAVGARLFITGNLHTESVTLYSLLFVSDDSGATWKEAYDRVRSGNLDQIQFVDFRHGWISGGILLALPRDPFFLVTRDGGQTWQDRPIYDDGGIGTVSDFWFTDASNGQMILDHTRTPENGNRYELHETATAGDTWSPKQLSPKPLKLNHPEHPASGWRLTPDAKTKTTRLETERVGGKWDSIASFPIRVPDCKPPEPKPQPQQ